MDASDINETQVDRTPPPPATLAKYFRQFDILEMVGHGGMGAVYKAMHTVLDRVVAIKIIVPQAAAKPGFAERFAREAKALAKLSHPNIVSVFDFGLAQPPEPNSLALPPLHYLVMEYVDGINLRQSMAGRSLSPDETLSIITQICEALQYAHQVGVIHRDIKPENLLISKIPSASGTQSSSRVLVKIVDFGLAKLIENEASSNLTVTHQVMGTVRYMAPEQMDGFNVDHRADIYSLGVVFYEMLTGHLPVGTFERPSQSADVDIRIDDVIMRSLAREPGQRYQQAIEIKTAVDGIQSQPKRSELPVATNTKPMDGAMFFGGLTFVGLAALLYWFTQSHWASMGLLLPCAFLGFWISRFRDRLTVRGIAASVTLCTLSAVVLIVVIAGFLEWSTVAKTLACVLLVLLMAAMASLCALAGNELRKRARMTSAEKEERSRKAKESKTRGGIQEHAFLVGVIGFFRTLSLFSINPMKDTSQASWTHWLTITGPILIAAAISMHFTRYITFCAIGCFLCFVTGNPIAILVGIAGLATLFKNDVQELFEQQRRSGHTSRLQSTTPATDATVAYSPTLAQTIQHRWRSFSRACDNWIRRWNGTGLQIIRSVLLLSHIACMFLIFSFHFQTKRSGYDKEVLFTLGSPAPWFTTEIYQKATKKESGDGISLNLGSSMKSGVNWGIQYQSVICWIGLVAVASALAIWRIDHVTKPASLSRFHPASVLKIWGLVLLGMVALGMLLVITNELTSRQ